MATSSQIMQRLLAAILARSPITDVAEGSVVSQLAGAFAAELAGADHQIEAMREEFFLAVGGVRLDERGAQIPGQPPRHAATPAAGPVVVLYRDPSRVGVQDVIEVGGLTLSRADDPSITYTNDEQIVFEVGSAQASGVRVTSQVFGARSNCALALLTGIVAGPSWLTSATNTQRLTNGEDAEVDADYRARLWQWLSSLARCQPTALEAAALAFRASSGQRARYAALYEDLLQPGYSELVIDDGSAGAGGVRDGATTGGTVPATGALYLYHEYPATGPITQIKITRSGSPFYLQEGVSFRSLFERGIIVPFDGVLEDGDVWEVGVLADGSQYQVRTGLPAELQTHIEGNTSTPAQRPGYRAAGTRVVVRPARAQLVNFDLALVTQGDTTGLEKRILDGAVGFLQTLRPGQTFYPSNLAAVLENDPSVVSVRVYQTASSTPMPDTTPSARDVALRTEAGRVRVVALPGT